MSLINYQGDSKIIKRICQLLKVTDVQDGEGHSLVDSNGIAVVTGGGGGSSTLAGLSDVDTTGTSAGDVLAYNGTSQKWEDKTLASVAMSGSYNDLSNTPTIPDELSDLSDDSTHRLVTDSEKTAWSAKVDDNPTFSEASTRANIASGESFATILGKIKKYFTDLASVAFSGSYNDLSNQPTIPSVSANPSTTTATLTGIEIDGTAYAVQGGSANVQSDWNETDTTADDYIKNKPTMWDMSHDGDYIGAAIVGEIDPQTLQPLWQATQFYPRITTKASDANRDLYYDTNKVAWIEHSLGASYNLPTTDSYYNIITMVGDSNDRQTQLAISPQGMGVYYRAYDHDHWTAWRSLVTDSSKVSKSGDTMTGTLRVVKENAGTTEETSQLTLGNSTPAGTVGNSKGAIALYSNSEYVAYIMARNLTSDRLIDFPDKAGTLALREDVPEEVSNTNGVAYKFPNGMMMCTKTVNFGFKTFDTAWGSMYEASGGGLDFGNWAVEFYAKPTVTLSLVGAGGTCFLGNLNNGTKTYIGACGCARPNMATMQVVVDVIGIGRWKA